MKRFSLFIWIGVVVLTVLTFSWAQNSCESDPFEQCIAEGRPQSECECEYHLADQFDSIGECLCSPAFQEISSCASVNLVTPPVKNEYLRVHVAQLGVGLIGLDSLEQGFELFEKEGPYFIDLLEPTNNAIPAKWLGEVENKDEIIHGFMTLTPHPENRHQSIYVEGQVTSYAGEVINFIFSSRNYPLPLDSTGTQGFSFSDAEDSLRILLEFNLEKWFEGVFKEIHQGGAVRFQSKTRFQSAAQSQPAQSLFDIRIDEKNNPELYGLIIENIRESLSIGKDGDFDLFLPDYEKALGTGFGIVSVPSPKAFTSVPYQYQPRITGPMKGSVRWHLLYGPPGMTLNEKTGAIFWDPKQDNRDEIGQNTAGDTPKRYRVGISADVAEQIVEQTFTLDLFDEDLTVAGDIDGDGHADYPTWKRDENGDATLIMTMASENSDTVIGQGGIKQVSFALDTKLNIPFLCDFDGDKRDELALWYVSEGVGQWKIFSYQDDFSVPEGPVNLGKWGDIPMVGDFNGDKKCDLAVHDRSTAAPDPQFVVRLRSLGGDRFEEAAQTISFGNQAYTEMPRSGDFDGDGRADLALFRPEQGTWWILHANTSTENGFDPSPLDPPVSFGNPAYREMPLIGDFNYDNCADLVIWRQGVPGRGYWIKEAVCNGKRWSIWAMV